MAISTDSIIHYTNSLDTLKAILKEGGLKLKYCNEELRLGVGSSNTAHPMVSFCDIPLSNSKKHFDAYGKYGIGLTKKWAFVKQINPVLYIDRNSLIADNLHTLIKSEEQVPQIQRIKSCAKNYSGKLTKNNITTFEYRFYDEREWRFTPAIDDEEFNKCKSAISIKTVLYLDNKDRYNEQIKEYRLKFDPDDISYIIVEFTSEISEVINFLRNEYQSRCTAKELDILFSKVCSTEQIIADY
ncbi:hypothetical protein AGMMS49574_29420 [Bacteroidia bacterium]|nr:hypothetical protein AGMMS49574_29420 [Bacteroidia bacterium]